MDHELKGKTAIVTGSSKGIGKSIAFALAKEGCNLILCGRNSFKLATAVDQIKKIDAVGTVHYEIVDGTKADTVINFFKKIPRYCDSLDILVNNIGGGTDKSRKFLDLEDADWLRLYELNFMSAVRFIRCTLPMLTRSKNGRIINIGTLPSRQPGFTNPHYSAAKAALLYLNKYLANDLVKNGICVNIILPHSLLGETWEKNVLDRAISNSISVAEAREIMSKEVCGKIPMSRQGTAEDVANLVVFLASPKANYITGTAIAVDGGTIRSIF
ncbi:MAG: SDR family oxidoreductase [Minisyncoccia bacterium]